MTDKPKSMVPKVRFKGFTDDWEQRKLGEVTKISSASRVHRGEWRSNGVPFFRSSDIVSKFKGLKNKKVYISTELYNRLSDQSGQLEKNDILITGGGSIGIPYVVEDDNPLYSKDADVLWIRRSHYFNSYFIYYYLIDDSFRRYLHSISHVGTIAHFTIEQAEKVPINLPHLREQEKVSKVFNVLSKAITLQQRKLKQLNTFKKALLQKMFADQNHLKPEIRFNGFSEEWEQRKLGEVVKVTMGQSPDGKTYSDKPSNYILVQGNADLVDGWVVPRIWTTQKTKEAHKGDLILSVRAPAGEIGKTSYDVILGRGVAGIQANDFIYQLLYKMSKIGYWNKYSTGSTFASLNSKDITNAKIYIASSSEQKRIGDALGKLDTIITLQHKKIEMINSLKKFLLQTMFF